MNLAIFAPKPDPFPPGSVRRAMKGIVRALSVSLTAKGDKRINVLRTGAISKPNPEAFTKLLPSINLYVTQYSLNYRTAKTRWFFAIIAVRMRHCLLRYI